MDNEYILNPATGRYVLRRGPIGRALAARYKSSSERPCQSGYIRNPASDRCVQRSGNIGRALVARVKRRSPRSRKPSRKPCPNGQVRNEKTGRCRKVREGYELNSGKWRKQCSPDQVRNFKTGRCRKGKGESFVFVYGTLMKGFSNHRLLKGAKYLGLAQTVKKYRMSVGDYPLVNEKKADTKITGELYSVSNKILKNLDELEGYKGNDRSNNYYRKFVPVVNNDKRVDAYVYFNDKRGDYNVDSGDYRLDNDRVYYFSYGSNMDRKRMEDRLDDAEIHRVLPATLPGFRMAFNKTSSKSGYGYANVVRDTCSDVEGVLYEIDEDGIFDLDREEGVPTHYARKEKIVNSDGVELPAFVYIANPKKVKKGLKVEKEYLAHLLKGQKYLSKKYVQYIKNAAR